jgi:hypothetical protein
VNKSSTAEHQLAVNLDEMGKNANSNMDHGDGEIIEAAARLFLQLALRLPYDRRRDL